MQIVVIGHQGLNLCREPMREPMVNIRERKEHLIKLEQENEQSRLDHLANSQPYKKAFYKR